MNRFDNLPSDVIIYMALLMDLPEILSFCATSTRFNEIICQDTPKSVFWISRLQQDFNVNWEDYKSRSQKYNISEAFLTPKQFYHMIKDLENTGCDEFKKAITTKNIFLAEYIIDNWISNLQEYYSLDDCIIYILDSIREPIMYKYILSKMTDDIVSFENINGTWKISENIVSSIELYDLILSKFDKHGAEIWMEQIANMLNDVYEQSHIFFIETLKILRKYDSIHDLHISEKLLNEVNFRDLIIKQAL